MRTEIYWPVKPEWRLQAGGSCEAGTKRGEAKGCWPAGAGREIDGCRSFFKMPAARCVLLPAKSGILDI